LPPKGQERHPSSGVRTSREADINCIVKKERDVQERVISNHRSFAAVAWCSDRTQEIFPKKYLRSSNAGLKMALSSKVQENRTLVVVDKLEMDEVKTKTFANIIKGLGCPEKALIVTGERDEKLELSSRNIPGVKILQTQGLNVYDILKYPKLVILQPALKG
jgi:ribosomal protein L4